MKPRVMIVESVASIRAVLRNALFGRCEIVEPSLPSFAPRLFRGERIDLVLLGSVGPVASDSIACIDDLRAASPGVPIFFLAAERSEELAIAALRAHVDDYFRPPLSIPALLAAIEARFGNGHKPANGTPLIGDSLSLQHLREYLLKVAQSECNVLITGETGTGKELVARFVHQNSARRARPMISVNCAAVPDLLLESELFGYERGAFTGATTNRDGKARAADGGTLFFDEIGEMTPYAQAKILRMIENGEIQKLGARKSDAVDVRVIAATNLVLEEKIREQSFRADLYFRLNVARIVLPPLRERRDDVPCLAEHFIADLNRRCHLAVNGVTPRAMEILLRHDWPGNVRELRNVVEAAFINRPSSKIDVEHLPAAIRDPRACCDGEPPERDRVLSALQQANGNKSLAARMLHCSRMTLYRRMERLGVTPE